MKLLSALKYILNSASYGVIVAVVLLLLIPELRDGNGSWWNILASSKQSEQPHSYARAVQQASAAVVNIYSEKIQPSFNYNRSHRTTELGSGVIMNANGYLLTNYHVVQDADLIGVVLQNGDRYPAELIGYDVYTDLAVLKVAATNLPTIPQDENLTSYVGDVVLAIGNPFNLGQTVTQGIISGTGRSGLSSTSYQEFLQMDAAINEGNSGGALVNSNGVLVGINSRKYINSREYSFDPELSIQGIFFAVPYKLAHKIMRKIIEDGRVIRGWLGVSTNSRFARSTGFLIGEIQPNSPAHKAGLQVNDLIYQIDGVEIHSISQALDIVAETKPNTTLIFKVARGELPLDIPVVIEEKR
ncbi:trypsin-like peptidase domain-containing protein [Thalassotalea piscium]|uniref:Serine protease DegS n=1 Tax=Thalassotalea piscium TaxID=1230533 RepID=A0A7X0TU20_9GAMM|nr:trypsin-like peptidase domain-containing protein [Thalassotalea piscium]MBB6543733.1 serine protease DegS [Thalassotalea piscium]